MRLIQKPKSCQIDFIHIVLLFCNRSPIGNKSTSLSPTSTSTSII